MASRGHVRAWLVAIVVATVVFSVLYALLEGWSLYDGLYMTIISLTTVGFREVRELDDSGRLITMAASVTGVLLIFGGVGIMSEFVLAEIASGRRERKRMQDRIAALSGHFIVCGYGRVGSTVARELREHERGVVVIDVNESSLERAREDGHLVVFGDATHDTTLLAAGIARAAGLVATIDEDAYNVYVVLSARALNRDLFVVGRANLPAAEARLAQAGADRIVSPYTMAGRRIAELAIRPAVSDFIDAALSRAQVSFAIEEHRVLEGDALDGLSVGDLQARGIFTLAVVRGPGEYDAHPPVERILRTGDDLILSASSETLRSLGPTHDG
jgi:voltage-gated potassium channel